MTAAELMRDIKSNIEPQYNDIMHKMDLLLDSIEDFEDLNERYEEFRNHGGAPTESENLQNYISNLESMINVIDNQIRRLDNDIAQWEIYRANWLDTSEFRIDHSGNTRELFGHLHNLNNFYGFMVTDYRLDIMRDINRYGVIADRINNIARNSRNSINSARNSRNTINREPS